MSDGGAYQDEMGRFLLLGDREFERILSGRTLADDRDLDELAAFVGELTYAFRAAPDAVTETRHLNAIMQAVRALPPPDAAPGLKRRSPWLGPRALAWQLALAGALTLGLCSGVAYAGALPGPVQGAVADVARNVGVSLPGAHNDKDDGAQNDKQDGSPRIVPAPVQMGDNVAPETSRQGDKRSLVRPSGSEQENETQAGAPHQQGNVEPQNRDEENGTNGSSDAGQGAHGNVGATQGGGQSGDSRSGSEGAGSQGGGTQGGGRSESGETGNGPAGDGSQGDQRTGEN